MWETIRRLSVMNVCRSGGWILAILGITVILALGCEKGALGVKASMITGQIVEADSPTTPVVGAKVSLTTQGATAGEAALILGQNLVTVTDSQGVFTFENVGPDKLLLEAFAVGYEDLVYPSASSTVTSFYLGNGTTLDLGKISMRKVANPLSSTTVAIRGKILDGNSKDELDPSKALTMYFDGKQYNTTYADFTNGNLRIPAKIGNVDLVIIASNYATYKNVDDPPNTVNGNVDNVLNILLTPISYNVRVTFKKKPPYLNNKAIELNGANFAVVDYDSKQKTKCSITITSAIRTGTKPFKVLATDAVDLDKYEPEAVLPGISLPANLTILLSGYEEIATSVPFSADTQGTIAMPLDMTSSLFRDVLITRPVLITMQPKTETDASNSIRLFSTDNVRVNVQAGSFLDQTWAGALNTIDANALPFPTRRDLPCGYILPFSIMVDLTDPLNLGRLEFMNYYYIDPVPIQAPPATFTAHLIISKTDAFLVRP